MGNWVQTWGQAHAALSFFYYPSCKKTFRLVIKSAVSGNALRIRFSNLYGKSEIKAGDVTAALCDEYGKFADSGFTAVTVNGSKHFTLKAGETIISDEIPFHAEAGSYFCISIYTESGDLSSGNLINNAQLITAKGNLTARRYIKNQPRIRDYVRKAASKILGMFLHKPIPLFETAELYNNEDAKAIAVFGDSISQQGFWTNEFEKRIAAEFPAKYSVINKSIMGNRILRDYSKRFICKGLFGASALNRLENNILIYPNTKYVVFALGTNDFLQYGTIVTPKSEKPSVEAICSAVQNITEQLHSKGIKVIVFTILYFGESMDCNKEKLSMLSEFNNWLRKNRNMFDGLYDQAELCKNPEKPYCTKKEFLGPDKLHPNITGGKFIADNIDLNLFR